MKYTRYDLKRKRNNAAMVIVVLALMLTIAFVLGSVISNVFIKNSSIKNNPNELVDNPNGAVKESESAKSVNYLVIQGGLFQNKQYMETEKSLLVEYGNPFIIEEQKGSRVLLGIYSEEEGQNIIKTLNDKGVSNSKMTFRIDNKDLCDAEISGIISANIEVLTELAKKDVKSIQTEELKKWTAALKDVDKNSENIETLKELKAYINNLPKELGKDKASENYIYIFNLLKKLLGNKY